jgi:peptide deformylase
MSEHEHDHDHDHEHDHDHGEHDHGEHDHGEHDHEHSDEELREAELEALRRRALAQIRQYPDVALRMPAREVTEFDDHLLQLVERMQHLMHDAQGVGLAATQIGVLQRVFLIETEDDGLLAIVNPTVEISGELETDEEGCLSLWEVRVPVERSNKVTVVGKDPTGADVNLELEGLSARAAQHELDHLDGVLIIDRTDPESRKEALGKLRPQPVLR